MLTLHHNYGKLFTMKLFDHQKKMVEAAMKTHGIHAFYADMGIGKTLAALETYKALRELNPNLQLLVVCPLSLIESAWAEDIKKFTKLTYENLRKTQNLTADVLLINYESLISKRFNPTLRRLIDHRPMCVLDESQKIKSYNAKTTKILIKASPFFPYKLVMSATPAPNGEWEYWSQMCFLAPSLFGTNFFSFRNRYMALIRGTTVVPLHGLGKREMMMMLQRGYTMGMLPGANAIMQGKMQPYCQYIAKRDVLDLPEEINVNRFVDMTSEQKKAYRDMWDELVMEIQGEEVSVNIALAKIMKVRQITGGFAYLPTGSHGFNKNPKIEELENVVDEIGPGKSIVIFCQYKWEIEKIAGIYKERSSVLYSDTKDREVAIDEFKKRAGGILVAHPASGGVGLSFNECDYMIFYSMDYSFMNYYQARGRIMRAKKKNNATYIHLIARDSIDEIIMGALLRKEDSHKLFRSLMK